MAEYKDIGVERSGFVATIEIQRPPHNFFDIVLINSIADALEDLDNDDGCRANGGDFEAPEHVRLTILDGPHARPEETIAQYANDYNHRDDLGHGSVALAAIK